MKETETARLRRLSRVHLANAPERMYGAAYNPRRKNPTKTERWALFEAVRDENRRINRQS